MRPGARLALGLAAWALVAGTPAVVVAEPATPAAATAAAATADPALERRLQDITAELRCLVCQNQTVADSGSGLADDLRREVRQQLAAGKTDREVIEFMTQRYGDFVLYRPPVRAGTWLLWFGPALLLVAALGALAVALRRRARLPAERFEPDVRDD